MFRAARFRRMSIVTVLLALFVGLTVAPDACGEDVRETTSLGFVPADAAFYSSFLRGREQFDAVANSKALANLLELPFVKMGIEQLKAQWDDPEGEFAMFQALLADPENEALIDLLIDAVSHEVFVYGDETFVDLMQVYREWDRSVLELPPELIQDPESDEASKAIFVEMIKLFSKNEDKLKVPTTLIGFKLSDTERAPAQLARLEDLLRGALVEQPVLLEQLTREKVGETELLTLKLVGGMLPLDELPKDEVPAELADDVDKLIALYNKLTVIISVGVYGDYLVLSVAPDNKYLSSLGDGELLIDRDEFAHLRKFSDKKITSVGYVSDAFMKQFGSLKDTVDRLVFYAEAGIPMIPDLDDMVKRRMVNDAKELGADINKYIPEPGAVMGFSFLNGRGIESYWSDWSENLVLDGSKKLTILEHVGGSPLMFVANRTKVSDKEYDLLVKWVERGYAYFEKFGLPELSEEERALFELVASHVQPLLERFDKTTREAFIPAFEDGQTALVIDAKLTSQRWHKELPASETQLPILEVGLVCGITNPELVKKAASEYFSIAQDIATKLHEAAPEQIPEIKLPAPKSREFGSGEIFYYTFPRELGLDQRFAPNAGLSDEVLAFSVLPQFTKRMMDKTPLQLDGPLADVQRPLAAAAHFNFAGFVDMLKPWIDYGLAQDEVVAEIEEGVPLDQIKLHVDGVLGFLQCFRGASSATYVDGEALVTHSEWRFEDAQ